MPRHNEYWHRRDVGVCVECPTITANARCPACNEKRRLWVDRQGSKLARKNNPGAIRRLASHREQRERRRAYLRLGHGKGTPVSQEVRDRLDADRAVRRHHAPPPADGILPCDSLTLDSIDVDFWTVGDRPWAFPESFDRAEAWLARPPDGWLAGSTRWFTLAWDAGRFQQDIEGRVTALCGALVQLRVHAIA